MRALWLNFYQRLHEVHFHKEWVLWKAIIIIIDAVLTVLRRLLIFGRIKNTHILLLFTFLLTTFLYFFNLSFDSIIFFICNLVFLHYFLIKLLILSFSFLSIFFFFLTSFNFSFYFFFVFFLFNSSFILFFLFFSIFFHFFFLLMFIKFSYFINIFFIFPFIFPISLSFFFTAATIFWFFFFLYFLRYF